MKDIKAKDLKAEVSAELRRTFKPTTYRDQISVRFIFPPIPDRNFDWEATFADYEPGALIGYGITADAAVRDLQDQDYERQADDTYESNNNGLPNPSKHEPDIFYPTMTTGV